MSDLGHASAPASPAGGWPDASTTSPTPAALRTRLLARFEDEPVMDGEPHPAEAIIADALAAEPERTPQWLDALYAEFAARSPDRAADLLRCIGRCRAVARAPWAAAMIRRALLHEDAALRDAAVVTIDLWADPSLIAELHPEAEPKPWLAELMRQIRAHAA